MPLRELPYNPVPLDNFWVLCLACFYLKWPGLVHHLTPLPTSSSTILPCFLLACMDASPYTPYLYLFPLHCAVHFTLKIEVAWPSRTLVFYCNTTLCHNPEESDMKLLASKPGLTPYQNFL